MLSSHTSVNLGAHARQLFTGNTAFMPLAVIEGRASVRQLAVNWGASFIGNLAGALLAVSAVAGAGLVGNSGPAIPVALAKVQLPFSQARPISLQYTPALHVHAEWLLQPSIVL